MSHDLASTHIPVLIALGLTRQVRRVLELGAGWYSTPTFLNRKVFPQLEQLVSYEDNLEWQLKVQRGCLDTRLIISGTIPSLTDPYDLIFVDNAMDCVVRAATIRRVAAETRDVLVVLHDAEDVNYIPEIERFDWHRTIKTYNKWTAIAFNGSAGIVHYPSAAIETNWNSLEPTDIDGWLEVLSR